MRLYCHPLRYGDCYAADREVYKKITNKIKSGITEIENVEFSETKELGRVNKADPLDITYLRIRGMWGIQNPISVYDYLFENFDINTFKFIVIMKKEKYLWFFNTWYAKNTLKKVNMKIKWRKLTR